MFHRWEVGDEATWPLSEDHRQVLEENVRLLTHIFSTDLTWPFRHHLSLAMWPQTIFCLKFHPNPVSTVNSILVKKKWCAISCKKNCKNKSFHYTSELPIWRETDKENGQLWNFHGRFPCARCMGLSSIFKAKWTFECVSKHPLDFTVFLSGSFWDVGEKETYWPLKSSWSIYKVYCRLCFNISVEVFNRKEVQEPHILFLLDYWELPYLTIWEVI